MPEWAITVLLGAGPILWMLGGSGIPPLGKNWRRIFWPGLAIVFLCFSQIEWPVALATGVALWVANLLPYGDHTPWIGRYGVFLSLGLPALVINVNIWLIVLIASAFLTGAFIATKKVSWITHKLFEGAAGFLQAACLVSAVLR